MVLTNWAGPPKGNPLKLFLDNEIWPRLCRAASSPSGSDEIDLFSMLSSSSSVHLDNEQGMEPDDKRLYLQAESNRLISYSRRRINSH